MRSVLNTISTFLVLAAVAAALPALANGQAKSRSAKAELGWWPFEAGFKEAQGTGKKVILDVYTDWCGWCKKLDKDVYTDARVISYLNQYYVMVKLNAEDSAAVSYKEKESTKRDLAGAFGVKGYPTLIFFDSKGEAINSLPGYVDADKFLTIAKFIGEDYYKSETWDHFEKEYGSKQ